MGGELMVSRSQAENDFIKSLIEDNGEDHWIDCHDMNTERHCSSQSICGLGWSKWGDTCYARTDEPLSWTEARERCSKMGGEIMAPQSQAENESVRRLIEDSQEDHWIDCNDMKTERQWVCGGDSMQTYRNWTLYEPNYSGSGPHCARMIPTGVWRDYSCSGFYYAVCKYHIGEVDFQMRSWRLLSSCLMDHVICEFSVPSINGCAVKCSKKSGCQSFNVLHQGDKRICQLNDAKRFDVNKEEFVQMTKPLSIYGEQLTSLRE
ncbi:C-type lectin domain family 10 member A-like [Acanthaster planci]|uniref:C-type lectin domain family 10 member A-like n=1 Tax=Acanthaster planci TaxID=133434 RepID=A0A8B7ZMX9_ACAPL|nr:C-type lectin domain family 10 member A-like [Acanthaster planci]